jgi:hypothetical protein
LTKACSSPAFFDGIGEGGYRRSFAALKPGSLLCAYGYSAGVQAQRRMLTVLMWIARLYLEVVAWRQTAVTASPPGAASFMSRS